jgi:hypothetical protein
MGRQSRRPMGEKMTKRYLHFGVAAFLTVGTATLLAQQRGNSGLPPGPGNPLAALQEQIDALTLQVASLGPGAVQGGAESHLFVIRGTVGPSGTPLQGAGYSVTTTNNLPCGGPNTYPEYHVTFDQPFTLAPSIVVSARDVVSASPIDSGNAPVYTAAIDNGPGGGGVTINGFGVRIKSDAFGSLTTCFGNYHWDFIAIGQR